MRQVVLERPEHIAIRDVPKPEPGPGDALVRSERVGICGSDLHAYDGKHPFITLPVVPGHEVVGVVEAVGPGATEVSVGDRVVLEPNIVCGTCQYCRSGRYNLCENLTVVGCVGPLDGAMADYFIAPAQRFIVADPRLDLSQAAMVEPLATATHALRMAGGTAGKRVAVLGLGSIGLLTMQAARAGGASMVIATDLNPAKRKQATALGADDVFDPRESDTVGQIRERMGGSADTVFDCVAIQSTMDQAIALAHKGGTVIVEGVPEHDITVPLAIIQDREIRLQGTAMYTREDMMSAMNLIASGTVDAGSLVTSTIPVEQVAQGFASADAGQDIKVHLSFQ
jgi:2-desacetyl-2-hydroxyethyl bacteriochlorophyllide A dehydrogenase